MDIKIQLAKKEHVGDCLQSIKHSEVWDAYFESNPEAKKNQIEEMVRKKQTYVVLNSNGNCIGVMGVINNGCFCKYSYLALIAVKKRYRSKGIGEKLVNKFEEIGFNKADRVFVLVSDFNKKAQSFYKKLGYKKVGHIPDLFKNDISEHLLIKYKI